MTKSMFSVFFGLMFLTSAVWGQEVSSELEVMAVMDKYAKASIAKDVTFIQSVLAEDYSYLNPSGGKESRADLIKFIEPEKTTPTFEVKDFRSENVEVRIYGNTAIVTSDWVMDSRSLKAHDGDPPHRDKGRNSAILVRRGRNLETCSRA
jgi:ketosteroid isomerase-like protein